MLTALAIFAAIFGAQIVWLIAQDWWDARHVIAETQAEDMEAIVAATKELPAAGNAAAPVPRPAVPQQPAPPPGPHHDTGGLLCTIRTWACGCVISWDGQGRVTGTHACTPPATDWDRELKGLIP